MEHLTERQQNILHYVIGAHIESAQPVGSQYLTEKYRVRYSSATVRHEMGYLEETGYLTHPHISSGRIPTDRGYRYYVDHGLCQEMIPEVTLKRLASSLIPESEEQRSPSDCENYIEGLSRILSLLAEEASLVLLEDRESQRALRPRASKLVVQGSPFILNKPEFQDLQKIRALLRAFDEKLQLISWILQRTSEEGVAVTIGHENELEVLWDCSVVSARYYVDGKNTGAIAVLGPRRMRYARIIPLVEKIAALIEREFSQRSTEEQ